MGSSAARCQESSGALPAVLLVSPALFSQCEGWEFSIPVRRCLTLTGMAVVAIAPRSIQPQAYESAG